MTADKLVNIDKFQQWLQKLLMERGTDLFRSKGVLYTTEEENPYVFHAVHMLMSGSFENSPRTQKITNKTSRLIFIGRNLDRDMLTKGFQKCVV